MERKQTDTLNRRDLPRWFPAVLLFLVLISCQAGSRSRFVSFIADPAKADIQFYYKDAQGKPFRSIQNLKEHLEAQGKKLTFAMNGGMYMEDNRPLGLFIQNGKTVAKLNTRKAGGNF